MLKTWSVNVEVEEKIELDWGGENYIYISFEDWDKIVEYVKQERGTNKET